MSEKIKDAGNRGTAQFFPGLVFFFRRRLWPVRLAIIVAASAATVLLGIASFRYGSKLYRDWHQRRLLHRAASLLQEEKLDQAAQNARKVLTVDPNSLPAYYILAEAAEKQNLEEAVFWRARIAELLPKDPDSQLNLASAALRFGQIDLARKALNDVVPNHRGRAAFHVVAGWLARAEGNLAEQEEQFAAAVKEEPKPGPYSIDSLKSHLSAPARCERCLTTPYHAMICLRRTISRNSSKCRRKSHSATTSSA
jgi:Tetratricopeptide repeat